MLRYISVIIILISFCKCIKTDTALCPKLRAESCKAISNVAPGLSACNVTNCTQTINDVTICVNGTLNSQKLCYCSVKKFSDQSISYTDCCGRTVPGIESLVGKDITCEDVNKKQTETACRDYHKNICSHYSEYDCKSNCTETAIESGYCVNINFKYGPICYCYKYINAVYDYYKTDCCGIPVSDYVSNINIKTTCKKDIINPFNLTCPVLKNEACKSLTNSTFRLEECIMTNCTETANDRKVCVNGRHDYKMVCFCQINNFSDNTISFTDCCGGTVPDIASLVVKNIPCEDEIKYQNEKTCTDDHKKKCSIFSKYDCKLSNCTETAIESGYCVNINYIYGPVCFCEKIYKNLFKFYKTDCCGIPIADSVRLVDLNRYCKKDIVNSLNLACSVLKNEACLSLANSIGLKECILTNCTETTKDRKVCVNGKFNYKTLCFCQINNFTDNSISFTDCCGGTVPDIASLVEKNIPCEDEIKYQNEKACTDIYKEECRRYPEYDCKLSNCTDTSENFRICMTVYKSYGPICFCLNRIKPDNSHFYSDCCGTPLDYLNLDKIHHTCQKDFLNFTNLACSVLKNEACKSISNNNFELRECSVTNCTETAKDRKVCVNGQFKHNRLCFCQIDNFTDNAIAFTDCCGRAVPSIASLVGKISCEQENHESILSCSVMNGQVCEYLSFNYPSFKLCSVINCFETLNEVTSCVKGSYNNASICLCIIVNKEKRSSSIIDCCGKPVKSLDNLEGKNAVCEDDITSKYSLQCSFLKNTSCQLLASSFPNFGKCTLKKCTETIRDNEICVSGTLQSASICFCSNTSIADKRQSYSNCCGKQLSKYSFDNSVVNDLACFAVSHNQFYSVNPLIFLILTSLLSNALLT